MKPIAIALSPNTQLADQLEALKLMLTPQHWLKGHATDDLERALRPVIGIDHSVTFDSGRSSLFAILQAMAIGKGDEVLLQAYTCVVVPNAVRWTGATPIYVDVAAQSFNMHLADLKSKITKRTKAIIVQHTFGLPAEIEEVMELARKHKLKVIEDCAHALGADVLVDGSTWKQVGTFGDAAFISFGRDKVISSVYGGAAITNDAILASKLKTYQKSLPLPNKRWIAQQLFHPIIFALAVPTYFSGIGKAMLAASQKLGLLSKAVYNCEKTGKRHGSQPRQMPNALSILALKQLSKMSEFNKRRRKIARKYDEALLDMNSDNFRLPTTFADRNSIYLRYTIITPWADELMVFAKAQKILLGDWYQQVIAPRGIDLDAAQYKSGSCPVAEDLARQTINLPTHPRLRESDVRHVIGVVRAFVQQQQGETADAGR